MLQMCPAKRSLIPRWLQRGGTSQVESLRRCIDLPFLYRGVSTLDVRTLTVDENEAHVAFYARPVFPDERRIGHRTREAAFAEQLFQDAVTVLDTVWRRAKSVTVVNLSVWVRTVDGIGLETPVLSARATRDQAATGRARPRLAAVDVLRRFGARVRIDRHGNFHEERVLT